MICSRSIVEPSSSTARQQEAFLESKPFNCGLFIDSKGNTLIEEWFGPCDQDNQKCSLVMPQEDMKVDDHCCLNGVGVGA